MKETRVKIRKISEKVISLIRQKPFMFFYCIKKVKEITAVSATFNQCCSAIEEECHNCLF